MRLTHRILALFTLSSLIPLTLVMPASAQLSDSARVSVFTIYPGEAVHSLWGHSALRIWDPVTGIDIAYNYGTFDFGNPLSFIARFAYGKLDYRLALENSAARVEYSWFSQRRGVVEQQLNLTPSERQALYQYLSINALPENSTYRYDFLYDNCATRIRDALEYALQTPLADSISTGVTFRSLVRPYVHARPDLDMAINLAMGLPVDRYASQRDLAFLPIELQALLQNAQTATGAPLVLASDTLYGNPVTPQTRRSMSLPTGIAWLIFVVACGYFLRDLREPRQRKFDVVFLSAVTLIGLFVTFFWLVSLHAITRPNLHIMWAWPLHIIPLFLSRRSLVTIYWWCAAAGAAVFALGSAWWPQASPAIALPLALTVAVRCITLARVPRTGFEPVLPA